MTDVDSELLREGMFMTSYHFERGCRDFISLARLLSLDLNCDMDKLRPYLRMWFIAVREGMEACGDDITGASTTAEIATAMRCWPMWAYAQKLQPD